MHAKSATPAIDEHFKVATRLRRLNHAESVFLIGHRKIGSVVARDLQENSGVRAAFIGLTRGVQESRTESKASSRMFAVAHRLPDFLQLRFVCGIHLHEGEQRKIVARAQAIEMSAEIADQGFVLA